jgi:hypothetical protein
MSGPLVNGSSQTAAPFNFHLFFYYDMAEAPSSTFIPRRLLQLQSSSPLHPSSTSILLGNFIPRRRQLQPSSPFKFQTPSLCYFTPFSLMMPTVCLMLLLPDELLTNIIIHSIKDEPIFHFLNLRNKICSTFRRICNSDEVLLHVSLRDLRDACRNHYVRSCFERPFREANHPEALCFEGMERLMWWRNPYKGLKLIEDAAAKTLVPSTS